MKLGLASNTDIINYIKRDLAFEFESIEEGFTAGSGEREVEIALVGLSLFGNPTFITVTTSPFGSFAKDPYTEEDYERAAIAWLMDREDPGMLLSFSVINYAVSADGDKAVIRRRWGL